MAPGFPAEAADLRGLGQGSPDGGGRRQGGAGTCAESMGNTADPLCTYIYSIYIVYIYSLYIYSIYIVYIYSIYI